MPISTKSALLIHCFSTDFNGFVKIKEGILSRGGSTRWTWDPRGPRLREISKKSYAPRGKFVDINF